jgi:hypothetical protein
VTLLPLFTDSFLSQLSPGPLAELAPRWEDLRSQTHDDQVRLVIDDLLLKSYRRLGREPERRRAADRIKANPQGSGAVTSGFADDKALESLRNLVIGNFVDALSGNPRGTR